MDQLYQTKLNALNKNNLAETQFSLKVNSQQKNDINEFNVSIMKDENRKYGNAISYYKDLFFAFISEESIPLLLVSILFFFALVFLGRKGFFLMFIPSFFVNINIELTKTMKSHNEKLMEIDAFSIKE